MSDGVVFLNQQYFWPTVILGAFLWGIFIWKEWEQPKKSKLWINVIISFFAVAGLVLIYLKPGTWQNATKGKGIILTQEYRPAQLDSLKSIYKRIRTEDYTEGRTLSITKELDTLFVLGNGLENFDLWQLKEKSVTFLGGQPIYGWTKISFDDKIQLGELLYVHAKYRSPTDGHWAILTDNGGNPLDSILFKDVDEQNIRLSARPKASGRYEYRLVEKDRSNNILSEEPIPVQVLEGHPLKVLIVNAFPTFETKYLKNFLAEKGHQVVARTQLTKGKYKFEYFNGATNPVYRLSEQVYKNYDLLILDTESYLSLGSRARRSMKEYLEKYGTGVFVQPNDKTFSLASPQSPFLFTSNYQEEIVLGESSTVLKKYPFEFQLDIRTHPIKIDSTSVGAYVAIQKGKLGTSLLKNTYRLILNGQSELYGELWSQFVNDVSKRKDKPLQWTALTTTPRIDQPYNFKVRTGIEGIEVVTENGARIPLLQDLLLPSKWTGTHYPREVGWNVLKATNDSLEPHSYYVYSHDQYKSISKAKTVQANMREFDTKRTFSSINTETNSEIRPISTIWFYLIFLLCSGWLWLAPKLTGH